MGNCCPRPDAHLLFTVQAPCRQEYRYLFCTNSSLKSLILSVSYSCYWQLFLTVIHVPSTSRASRNKTYSASQFSKVKSSHCKETLHNLIMNYRHLKVFDHPTKVNIKYLPPWQCSSTALAMLFQPFAHIYWKKSPSITALYFSASSFNCCFLYNCYFSPQRFKWSRRSEASSVQPKFFSSQTFLLE